MSNLDTIFKVPLSGGGLILPSVVVFIGTKHRVQSPLERWPSMISMNRPKTESRPYEFLLQQHWQLSVSQTVGISDSLVPSQGLQVLTSLYTVP